jgi:1-acyl-sn-glycerol-3-phosphate acyltransferase
MTDDATTPQASSPGRDAVFTLNPRLTVTYRVVRRIVRALLTFWFHPSVEGPGSVPEDGPVIITPVHRSFTDFGFAIFLTDRKLFYIAKDSLWKSRLLGHFLLAMGAFPVHRESADRAAFGHAEEVLREGQVLVLFPEGTRQEGPLIGNILEGAAFLSARTGATIVPVGIGGSAKALPVGSKIPKRTKVNLFVSESIPSPPRNEKGRVPRSVVHETTVQLQAALQAAFDSASA